MFDVQSDMKTCHFDMLETGAANRLSYKLPRKNFLFVFLIIAYNFGDKGNVHMNQDEKDEFLNAAQELFRTSFLENHLNNTLKLGRIERFNINPFLVPYLSQFAYGNKDPESIAKVLLYPRVLGTSANTSFGNFIQKLCTKLKDTYPSSTSGMDIEFVDTFDGRKKYCQLKAGPETINKDDVDPIVRSFKSARKLIRTNSGNVLPEDFIVGVCYGDRKSLSANYKRIENEGYPIYIGKEFWRHLTGDDGFYQDLIDKLSDVARCIDASAELEQVLDKLTESIKNS